MANHTVIRSVAKKGVSFPWVGNDSSHLLSSGVETLCLLCIFHSVLSINILKNAERNPTIESYPMCCAVYVILSSLLCTHPKRGVQYTNRLFVKRNQLRLHLCGIEALEPFEQMLNGSIHY